MEYYDRRHLGTTPLSIGGAIPLESPVENGILPTYLARLVLQQETGNGKPFSRSKQALSKAQVPGFCLFPVAHPPLL